MPNDHGARPLPTDGRQDSRPQMVCTGCLKLQRCYRGPIIATIETPRGSFDRHVWM